MKPLKTPGSIRKSAPRRERPREQGQIIVLFVFVLIIILGAAAVVIDVGVLRNTNQNLWNALDAGALAGAQELPDDPDTAAALAMQYAELQLPGRPSSRRPAELPMHRRGRRRQPAPVRHPRCLRSGAQRRVGLQREDLRLGLRAVQPRERHLQRHHDGKHRERAVPIRPGRRGRHGNDQHGGIRRLQGRVRDEIRSARRPGPARRPDAEHGFDRHRERAPCRRFRAVVARRTTRRNSGWQWASSARRPRTTSASRTTRSSARIPTAPRI